MNHPKVYIDTNILKFSATQLPRLQPRQHTINWGGHTYEVTVHDFIDINPNDAIQNPNLKAEADLLRELAEAGKLGRINYVIQLEALFESWGLPNMDSATGIFYGAPYENIEAPIKYDRVLLNGRDNPKDMQYEFLASIKSSRFKELQKITGAYQGDRKLNLNQLLDAFHLWCAEHNKCDYFLTLDFKLIKMLRNRRTSLQVKVIRPSELLALVGSVPNIQPKEKHLEKP